MTAKEFLQQAFHLYREIDSKLEQLARLRELAMSVTCATDALTSTNRNTGSKMETAIIALHSQQVNFEAEILKLLKVWAQISDAVSKVDNVNERLILEYRYLAFEPWRTIADKMRLSLDSVFRIHRQALKNFRPAQ